MYLFTPVKAQYFGQNKVRYKNLKFKVHTSPHFEMYSYFKHDSLVNNFLKESEIWYDLHQQVFRDTFQKKNPLIIYNNHSDFQQTTVLPGEIGIGTGGVTEGLKNRVIMPIMQLNHQTRHVLGHELVHAFQYHSLIQGDSTQLQNIGNLPLWMVEGMAEYLSIGKVDAFTAMWIRDAYLNKDIPSLRALTESNKYFPYRYGEAFWAYIGSTYGDTVIVPFFKATAKYGYENAIKRTFGYDERTLSNLWKTSIENTYRPFLKDTAQTPVGTRLIDSKNGGDMNVAPAISPDGKYVIFLSEKNLFSIDLFLADAKTGKVFQRLSSKTSNSHIDEFSYIESAGAWSPDSKQFAFSVYSKGRNRLMIVEIPSGKIVQSESLGEVQEFSNLAWSPNGQNIALTGLKDGQSDLYLYDIKSKHLTQLNNDRYSDYQPNFSPDGKSLVFTSDRTTLDLSKGVDITYSLAVIDLKTREIQNITAFKGANNMNPQFSSNGKELYFLSNRDGFRNLYRYELNSQKTYQLTDYFTGICGITEYSPALSISKNDDILYSYYRSQKYVIYLAKPTQFKAQEVAQTSVNLAAAILPPGRQIGVDLVNANLSNFERYEKIDTNQIQSSRYRPRFQLDYLSGSGIGASIGRFGTGLNSGISGRFSDILGRNEIQATAAINGQIYDFGGQIAFINRESRINYGAAISHIPYMSGNYVQQFNYASNTPTGYNGVFTEATDIIRTFEDQFQLFASYPFSRTLRFEAGTSVARYSYRIERWYSDYYANKENGQITSIAYYPFDSDRRKLSKEEASSYYGTNFRAFNMFQVNAGLVGDNSTFGLTAPLDGHRYRVSIEHNMGDYNFSALNIDLRKYVRLKPVTIAARAYSYTRFGNNPTALYPLFIGYPYLIRGYEAGSFYRNNTTNASAYLGQLTGSKIAVGNVEVRIPFTGPEKLSVIPSKFLLSDLNLFFDIGLAYNSNSKLHWKLNDTPNQVAESTGDITGTSIIDRAPSMSIGASLRVNMFGYFVIEPYFAVPFSRKDVKTGVFGLNFAPGW